MWTAGGGRGLICQQRACLRACQSAAYLPPPHLCQGGVRARPVCAGLGAIILIGSENLPELLHLIGRREAQQTAPADIDLLIKKTLAALTSDFICVRL